jgi:hypothetical protein
MRLATLVLSGFAVVAVCVGAHGAGSIDATGATFTFGPAPDQGTPTVNASAPAAAAPTIPTLASHGTLGTFSSPLPAFGGGGTGADGAFVATVTQTLAGGTFDYSSYQVNAGVTVTYSGPVTILVTGGVTLDGVVRTNSTNAPITIRCGGSFLLNGAGSVSTNTEPSSVTIDVGGAFTGASGASVNARGADVEVTTHGLGGSNGAITLPATTLRTFQAGGVRVRAAGALTLTDSAFVSAWAGDVLMQAFGGDVTCSGRTRADASGPSDTVAVEASGSVSFTGDGTQVQIYVPVGAASVKAFGGDVQLLVAARVVAASSHVAASGNIKVAGASYLSIDGDAMLTAFGGDVRLEPTGGNYVLLASGNLRVGATGNIAVEGAGQVASILTTDLRAPAGRVTATSGITFGIVSDRPEAVSISAGAAGIDLGGAAVFADAALDVTALGPVAIGGTLVAGANLTVTSCDAGVDLTGASLRTLFTNGAIFAVSGDITVQSFADAAGVIDAAGVSFQTDAAGTRSGDVNLLVHADKVGGPPAPVSINAFLLPKSVTVRTNAKDPAKSTVTISGVLDEGSGSPDYAAASTLEVGGATFPIAGMTLKGRMYTYAAPGILFRVIPAKTASSRGMFQIVRTADLSAEVQKDGELRLRLFAPGFDAVGVAKLVAGKFGLGRVRGGLIQPCYFPSSVAATLKGLGKDTLTLTAGFSLADYGAIGGPGDIEPCFTIAVGGTFTATIDRAAFVPSKRGDKLTFRGDVNGITSVVIDLVKETITVKGSKMTLAGVTATSGPLSVSMTLDTVARGVDMRTFTVALNLAGKSLKY